VLAHESALVVGHNLDEGIEVPGLIVANPRGLSKRNVRFMDLMVWPIRSGRTRRLNWVSRYGSLTYNVFGHEFPDGGMNEAGLYVGEMTLLSTMWPSDRSVPRMYHHQWIQYLLDSFSTVREALASLSDALPEGHCRWHFFLADKGGDAAVVEFLGGKPVVHSGELLPHRILCNDPYEAELSDINDYAGFGGTKDPQPRYEKEDPRFRWAAAMVRNYTGQASPVDYAFTVLDRLNLGTRKWSIVCDIPNGRMHVRTSLAPTPRWVEMKGMDLACSSHALALDIHSDLEGDVTDQLRGLSPGENRDAVAGAWAGINLGLLGNLLFKPRLIHGLASAARSFSRAQV
jgi:hypothetical protein